MVSRDGMHNCVLAHIDMLTDEENKVGHWIRAYKPLGTGEQIEECDREDPDAIYWDLKYPGMPYSSSTVRFEDKSLAEEMVYVALRAYEAGGKSQMQELRRFLGIKD